MDSFRSRSIGGKNGSEAGVILQDEEHTLGARITLEETGSAPFAITCGIYGWMFHTRRFSSKEETQKEFADMKIHLLRILEQIPSVDDPEVNRKRREASDAISQFVDLFP
jgi:hypothetical protein